MDESEKSLDAFVFFLILKLSSLLVRSNVQLCLAITIMVLNGAADSEKIDCKAFS